MSINIQQLDDVQLALFLAVMNHSGSPYTMQTPSADIYHEWLKNKRKENEDKVDTPQPIKKRITLKECPGYEDHWNTNVGQYVCKHCGEIKYYH